MRLLRKGSCEANGLREFFSRLHHFVLVSDAFVVVPGGIGTVLELTMIWQLFAGPQAASGSAYFNWKKVARTG